MIIRIKGIYHERNEDAPFIGALISSIECNFNCIDCINHELKNLDYYYVKDVDIINEVLSNPFNKGIILGGLEWTIQIKEMLRLIELSIIYNLEVMVYTGMEIEELKQKIPELFNLNIYIKYGRYKKELKSEDYKIYGIKLASVNQNIIKIGK